MNAKEAKKLSNIEKALLKKFKAAEKKEVKKPDEEKPDILESPLLQQYMPKNMSVSSAQKIENLGEQLKREFSSQHHRELEEVRKLEKRYEPITKAIKSGEPSKDLVPVLSGFATSTPKPNRAIRFEDEEEEEDESSSLDLPTTPERESFRSNKSLKQLMDTKVITLGPIGVRYFPRANDRQFGIYHDEKDELIKIGSEPITFDQNDIILVKTNRKYKGTEGLWRLLTKNDYFDQVNMYTDEDWDAYKDILIRTNSLYQRNDRNSGKPKSSVGRKWKGMIKKVWDELKFLETSEDEEEVTGSGLAQYNDNPIEYKYINNLNELIKRLGFIQAQETAGNNNFHNEKLALAHFLGDRLQELIETPKGIKYLIRCLSVLPESMIEGSGLLNDIINNLPFELHWPGMSYLGPGTKLEKRLKRGDQGVNKLDEAAKEHDIWYRDHRNTEDRWEADKVLQKKAWDRVTSKDADFDERLPALVTTGAMWAKRKLGLGLSTSSCMYPE